MAPNVFISYSRKDKEIVTEIRNELCSVSSASFQMFDYDVEGIPEQYVLDAVHSINECDYFLFMLSDYSQFAEIPLMELAYANIKYEHTQKKIIVVNIDRCIISDSFLFRWGKYRILDWNNDNSKEQLVILLKTATEHINYNYPKLHKICRNGRYGFVNYKGEIVIPCIWTNVDVFQEGLAAVDDSSGKFGYLDLNGNRVIPCMWDRVEPFKDGMAVVKVKSGAWDYKCGVIDKDNNILLPTVYDSLAYIGDGLFEHRQCEHRYGIINSNNEVVSAPYLHSIGSFSNGLCPVQDRDGEHRYGYIDRSGRLVIRYWWNNADRFSEGLAVVTDKDGKYGVIDLQGNIVIPCYHDHLSEFHEGLCAFMKEGMIGFINKEDEIVIEATWKNDYYTCGFHNGRFKVKNDEGNYGYIDKSGTLVIPYTWTNAEDFDNGTAWVRVNDTWKLIDINGKYT